MSFRNISLTIIMIILLSLPITALADDHGDTWDTATYIGTLKSYSDQNHVDFSGEIELVGDEDWFSFSAEESLDDEYYVISLSSMLFANPIKNAKITLYSIDGSSYIKSDQEISCSNDELLRFSWVCISPGTYYLKVEGLGDSCNTGEYQGSVNILSTTNKSDSELSCFIASASYSDNEERVLIIDKIISILVPWARFRH